MTSAEVPSVWGVAMAMVQCSRCENWVPESQLNADVKPPLCNSCLASEQAAPLVTPETDPVAARPTSREPPFFSPTDSGVPEGVRNTRAIAAGIGAFLGINGLSQLVYRVGLECIGHNINGECVNRAGGTGWFVGRWSEEEGFAGAWLVIGLVYSGLAVVLASYIDARGG